tara:strand:- start:2114 stop:2797 length:684 start_codon:yes stop_codon:yes gene_type:complete
MSNIVRIAHASDLHADWRTLEHINKLGNIDVIVLTGDMLDNYGRWEYHRINPKAEKVFQKAWLKHVVPEWIKVFAGRPVVVVDGNHDFISLADAIKDEGYDNVFDVGIAGVTAHVAGLKFAGFREIPWIAGEWAGEVVAFDGIIEDILKANPDVLVTHAPPAGILDGFAGENHGIPSLTSALMYAEHKIRAHLFGHIHACGGRTEEVNGILFANGARSVHVIEVEGK